MQFENELLKYQGNKGRFMFSMLCRLFALIVFSLVFFVGYNKVFIERNKEIISENISSEDLMADNLPLKWVYEEIQDPISSQMISRAYVYSRNLVNLKPPYSGRQRAKLIIQNHPRFGNSAILKIERGQFVCSINDCEVNISFDAVFGSKYQSSPSKDYSPEIIFIGEYREFIYQIRKSKAMKIAATVYLEGEKIFDFDISELPSSSSFDFKYINP
jgi:hypothetical protein